MKNTINNIFKALALGLGVATFTLSILDKIVVKEAIKLLSLGISSLAISQLQDNKVKAK